MITIVKQLAMSKYIVSDAILPPNFSVITGAAAAVGQITLIKTPSQSNFIVVSPERLQPIIASMAREVRIICKMKCHLRGRMSCTFILIKVR